MVPTTLQSCIEFSNIMAKGNLVPAHLKNPADCLRVVMQAARWQLDPFAVADKTSIINGKIMHEGQLVMSVINARGNLSERLSYTYKGEGDARVVTVSGKIKGESEARTIDLTFALAKKINRNGQMGINPDQQASYIGARIWARRHMPELMMGVYTPDEIDPDEPIQVNPPIVTTRDEAPAPAASVTVGAQADAKRGRGRPPKVAAPVVDADFTEAPPANEPKPLVQEAPPAEVAEPARTALKDGEKFSGVCTVTAMKLDTVKSAGSDHPSVIAELSGAFVGKVYHLGGATIQAGALVAGPAWQTNSPVAIKLIGRARKDPKMPCTIFVEAIEIAADSTVD